MAGILGIPFAIAYYVLVRGELKELNSSGELDDKIRDRDYKLTMKEANFAHYYSASVWRRENLWFPSQNDLCFIKNNKLGPYNISEMIQTYFMDIARLFGFIATLTLGVVFSIGTVIPGYTLDYIMANSFEEF